MSSGFVAACKGLQEQLRTSAFDSRGMLSNQIMQLKSSCRCRKAIQPHCQALNSTHVNGFRV